MNRTWGKGLGFFSSNYVLIDARRAIQNRFITKLISVFHSGIALAGTVCWG